MGQVAVTVNDSCRKVGCIKKNWTLCLTIACPVWQSALYSDIKQNHFREILVSSHTCVALNSITVPALSCNRELTPLYSLMQGCYHYRKNDKLILMSIPLNKHRPHFFALMNSTLFSVQPDAFVSVQLFSQTEYFISAMLLRAFSVALTLCWVVLIRHLMDTKVPLQPASASSQAINMHFLCAVYTQKQWVTVLDSVPPELFFIIGKA